MHATRAWTMMFLSGLVFLAAVVLGAAPVSAYEECHEAGPATSCTSVSTNSPPEPDFTWAHTGNGTVAFTDQSRDDGSIVRWLWTFGDGNASDQTHPEHVYAPGSYGVRLQVEDDQGAVANTTRIIEVPEDTGKDGSGDGTDAGNGTDDGSGAGNGTDDGSGAGNGTDDGSGAGNGTDDGSGAHGDGGNGTDGGQAGNGTNDDQTTGNGTNDDQTTGNSTDGNSTDGGRGDDGTGTTGDGGDGGDNNATNEAGDDGPGDQEQGARASGRTRSDADGDGVADGHDVCPAVVDPDQADHDGDGVGDACGDAPAGCDCGGNATAEVHGDVGPGATDVGSGVAPAGRGLEPAPVHDHYETSYPAWEGPRSEAPAPWAIGLVCTGMLAPGLLANTWRATQRVRARRRAADPFRA